jgi:hypothetical protein
MYLHDVQAAGGSAETPAYSGEFIRRRLMVFIGIVIGCAAAAGAAPLGNSDAAGIVQRR